MLQLTLNGSPLSLPEGSCLQDVVQQYMPKASVVIRNGFQTGENVPLHEGDSITAIEKGVMPPQDVLEHMMAARHTPQVHQRVKQACVGIAGLGGLGSNIAAMLARTGVGHLILVDFDTVEPSNLNRQNYFVSHLGMNKTDATAQLLHQINPFIQVETHTVRVDSSNAVTLFGGCDVVCEAFDNPNCKAELVSTLLSETDSVRIVAGSGMAGYGSSNDIVTRKRMSRLYVCGDGETAAANGVGLMAPRVSVCAGHQANMTLRLLLDIFEV
ncbi:MAG: sulfur carrier protein ThiS adenylyltransferase ThiF [Eubacteriales bacterium]|nr:sulfur carrier protein ThiS adenylyltransferase ThiF [Eubacteriales bacterium]